MCDSLRVFSFFFFAFSFGPLSVQANWPSYSLGLSTRTVSVYPHSLGLSTHSLSIHTASVYQHYLIYPQSLGLSALLSLSTHPRSIHTHSLSLRVDRPRLYEGQFACTLRGPKEKAKKKKEKTRKESHILLLWSMVWTGKSLWSTWGFHCFARVVRHQCSPG